jgi:hypothetical protein
MDMAVGDAVGGGCLAVGGGLWVMEVVGMVGIWPWVVDGLWVLCEPVWQCLCLCMWNLVHM